MWCKEDRLHDVTTWVAAAKRRDQQAWDRLHAHTLPMLRLFFRQRITAADVIDDLLQRSYLHAFRHLDELREPPRFGGWLLAIARREWLTWLREQHRPLGALMPITTETRRSNCCSNTVREPP